jgi:hypothetical protein
MGETLPNTTITTDATLFREEAERARRYAAAMTDKKIIDRLNEIAALYDELAADTPDQPTANKPNAAFTCPRICQTRDSGSVSQP